MKRGIIVCCLLVFLSGKSAAQGSDHTLKSDSGYINVDGGRLFYETAGQGENIVLLHDGIVHHIIWDDEFPMLAQTFRVVRYDRRGFGKTVDPKTPYSNVEDLDQVFLQLKIDKAIVFGMSAGGGLAINFALKYPEKVRALVLVGAVVYGYGYSSHMLTRGGHIRSLDEVMKPAKFIRYFGWDDPYEVYPENVKAKEKLLKILKANPGNIQGALFSNQLPPDRVAVRYLSEIKAPTLVLVGEYDIPDVHAHAGAIESGIPGAKREIIPKSGHLIPLEQPEAFHTSVIKFLQSMEFNQALQSQGVDAAVKYFHDRRKDRPDAVLFEEGEMNGKGYTCLQEGKIREAIELFKLNTIAYPQSANTFDSLGEAYMKNGDTSLAIAKYRKSLELNPQNDNAREMLKQLEGKE